LNRNFHSEKPNDKRRQDCGNMVREEQIELPPLLVEFLQEVELATQVPLESMTDWERFVIDKCIPKQDEAIQAHLKYVAKNKTKTKQKLNFLVNTSNLFSHISQCAIRHNTIATEVVRGVGSSRAFRSASLEEASQLWHHHCASSSLCAHPPSPSWPPPQAVQH
jgi:hypothetical protein